MIGKLLNNELTVEEEDRVLCTKMQPGDYRAGVIFGPCLVGTILDIEHIARGTDWRGQRFGSPWDLGKRTVEGRYDALCGRFTLERVNNAIRNRILTNRVKRVLKPITQLVGVEQ